MLLRRLLAIALAAAPAAAQEKLSLDEAVRRAVIRNTSSLIAQQEIARAEAILRELRAPSLPGITGNATGTVLDHARVFPGSTTAVAPQKSIGANLVVTLPLVAPQRWAQWSHAGDQVEVARLSLEDARRAVGVAAARAYLAVVAQHRLVTITSQARDAAKLHFDDAHARFEVGSGNRLDEVRSAQELATDESQLAAVLANLVRSREALGVLVGEEGPVEVQDQVALPAAPGPEEAERDAEEKRPDVLAQRERTEAARRVLRDSWTDYMPLLLGVLQPFYSNPATTTQPETGWQAQLVLSLPLYEGGFRYGARRERSALYEEQRIQLDGLLRQARSDLRAAFDAVRRADESVAAAHQASRLAHEALDMSNLAYREGATNDLEVVDAERRARDADTAALVAEDAARQARIDLLAASGRFP
jgi:outer membrane protein TolC